MARAKPRKPATVAICINVPVRLARRLDNMLANLRTEDYAYISRSAFYSYCLGEWLQIVDRPEREPAPAQEVRERLRPEPRALPNGNSKLTAAKVRAIRRDTREIRVIARDLGVAATTVSRARSGETWGWVR